MPTSLTTEPPQQPTNHHSSHCHPSHHDLSFSRRFLKQLLKPCTVMIVLSFVVALINPLKALFLLPSSNFQPRFRPAAPYGQPPLAFIFDTATIVGAACIPFDVPRQRPRLLKLAIGRPSPQRRDCLAGTEKGDRHPYNWHRDHTIVRALGFRAPR